MPAQGPITGTSVIAATIVDHEARIAALEAAGAAPLPPPTPENRIIQVAGYYMPDHQFAYAASKSFRVGHAWAPSTGYATAAHTHGLMMDIELAVNAGYAQTPQDVTNLLNEAKTGPAWDSVRTILLLDEPDLFPPDTQFWQEPGLLQSLYQACKAVAPNLPVLINLRAHDTTLALCPPYIGNDVCDLVSYNPYLWNVGGPTTFEQITREAQELKAIMPAGKHLRAVIQAAQMGWVSNDIPTAENVRDMGLAAIQGGSESIAIWMDDDWPVEANAPKTDPWARIEIPVNAWLAALQSPAVLATSVAMLPPIPKKARPPAPLLRRPAGYRPPGAPMALDRR